jgi:hypothetical protein
MSASNFHNSNCSKVFVIDFGEDEFMWQELQRYLGNWMKELNSSFELDYDITSVDELRSYPSSSIGYIEVEDQFIGDFNDDGPTCIDIDVKVNTFMRAGYYEAACLDWEVEVCLNSIEYENYADLDKYDALDLEVPFDKISDLESIVTKLVDKTTDRIEALFTQISEPYNCIGTASNGEAFYQKVKE